MPSIVCSQGKIKQVPIQQLLEGVFSNIEIQAQQKIIQNHYHIEGNRGSIHIADEQHGELKQNNRNYNLSVSTGSISEAIEAFKELWGRWFPIK